jgi:hypothetical protein
MEVSTSLTKVPNPIKAEKVPQISSKQPKKENLSKGEPKKVIPPATERKRKKRIKRKMRIENKKKKTQRKQRTKK